MLNHIVIMGRLTRDPELRRTGNGTAVASFTIAVDRDYTPQGQEKEVDFIDCVAWRHTGEFVSKYFTKGSMAVVSGRLQIRSYNDKDGNKRKISEVVADSVYFGESKRSSEGGSHHGAGSYQQPGYAPSNCYPGNGQQTGGYAMPNTGSEFAMLEDDDSQLPF